MISRFNTHLATGIMAIGFTGIVLGEFLLYMDTMSFNCKILLIAVNTVFFNPTPEFLKQTGVKTILPGENYN